MKSITVHILSSCPYCQRVVQYLQENDLEHTAIDYSDKRDDLAALKAKTGHSTVPQVFFGDTLVGGCDDFFKIVEAGQLTQRLS